MICRRALAPRANRWVSPCAHRVLHRTHRQPWRRTRRQACRWRAPPRGSRGGRGGGPGAPAPPPPPPPPPGRGRGRAGAAQPGTARSVQGPALDMARCGALVRELIDTICAHRQYLSEIDGLIGDGDHGINMSKGFAGCGERLDRLGEAEALQLPKALEQLSQALMDDIGGSMGPLYGRFFMGFVSTLEHHAQLDAALFGQALAAAVANVQAMGNAQPG